MVISFTGAGGWVGINFCNCGGGRGWLVQFFIVVLVLVSVLVLVMV